MRTFIDIKHFAAIFRFTDIQHFAGTDCTPAMRIIQITDSFHFYHVLTTDRLIATFIKQDTRIIAVINDSVTHQFCTLFPLTSFTIFLGITGLHSLNQSYTVTRLDILFPRSDMHPAHKVRIALYHQMIAIIAQPGRHAHPDSRPFIARPLCKALHLNNAIIQPDHSFTETRFTESGTGSDLVYFPAIYPQTCLYRIQIAISPTPEMQVVYLRCRFQCDCFTRFHHRLCFSECLDGCPVTVYQFHLIRYLLITIIFVLDFRLRMNDSFL